MENTESKPTITPVPVPRPRKIFLKRSQYVNVSISKEGATQDKNNDNKVQLALTSDSNAQLSNNEIQIKENKIQNENSAKNNNLYSSLNSRNVTLNFPEDKEHNVKNLKEASNTFYCKGNNNDINDIKNNNGSSNSKNINCKTTNKYENKEYESVYLKKQGETLNNLSVLPSNSNSSVTSRASTPEPFYINQEQLSVNHNIFNINLGIDDTCKKPVEREVLYEFDPLMQQRNSTRNDASSQLILLQSLLQDDIYGNVFGGLQLNLSPNEELSDEDNVNNEIYLPPTPTRVDSLESTSTSSIKDTEKRENKPSLGAKLFSRSKAYKSQTDLTNSQDSMPDGTHADQSRKTQTSWYLTSPEDLPLSSNPVILDETPPPPYSETAPKSSFHKYVSNINDNFGINGKSELNKMITNFYSKINAIKRKPSLKSTRPQIEKPIKAEIIPRPKLTENMIRHEGFLIRFPSGTIEDIFKELQNRKAIISDSKFLAYQESELKNLKETIHLYEISTLQCVSNSKITENSTHYYCFEITTVMPKALAQQKFLNSNNRKNGNFKAQRLTHLYGISKESERNLWMQKLLQSLTDVFPSNYTCQFYRAGWCYMKKSITAQWSGAWIMLLKRKRKLLTFIESELRLEKIDLRKARCIVMKESDNSVENLCIEQGPILMIDCPPYSLYVILSCSRETKIWKHIIREVACNNGPGLDEQQLTKHNIPVIIDKCINFLYIHGSMSEGIYRKSGSENIIQKLMYEFRSNAFNVEITKNEYSEHDVANVLKRFMRNLPQRLLGRSSDSLVSVSQLNSLSDKIISYKELLARLSSIEFMTIKKLINHLWFIESQSSYNKMTLENLAVIWGPTLLQTNTGSEDLEYNHQEAQVLKDLILNFKILFPLTKDEISKENSMLHYLKKYYAASESLNELTVKQSGDLKVWVAIKLESLDFQNDEEEQNSICIILQPGRTAIDVCKEIALKIKKTEKELCLFEVIFNNSLERPLHDEEKLFQAVLRWSYWPEDDRKNNCLVIKSSKYLEKMTRTLDVMKNYSFKKTLQYADNKTKNFKSYEIELNDTKLSVSKISKGGNLPPKYHDLQNFSIFLGSERKISFQWAITLIENNQTLSLKNPETNFPGHVVAGQNKDDQIILFSNIWKQIYGGIKKL